VTGTLYIVGTPIGNLKDITLRAIEILEFVDIIACEDTRHTKILLDKYSIKKQTTSYHKFNIKAKTNYIIGQIRSGKNIALVSDAGMPGISDPGQELVKASLDQGIKVEVIPGASAAISALSVSGLKTDKFIFEGFLPLTSSQRKERLKALSLDDRTIIIYEAPHRLIKTLEDIRNSIGDRNISIIRELTKKFEEISRGKVSDLVVKFNKRKPKGEFVLIIEGAAGNMKNLEDPNMLVFDLVKAGVTKSDAVKIIAKRLKVPRNKLYRAALRG